jgi:hypothetical protein
MVVEMKLYMPLVLVPKIDTEVTMTRKISDTMRAYSMAVAPRRSRAKLRANR